MKEVFFSLLFQFFKCSIFHYDLTRLTNNNNIEYIYISSQSPSTLLRPPTTTTEEMTKRQKMGISMDRRASVAIGLDVLMKMDALPESQKFVFFFFFFFLKIKMEKGKGW